MTKFDEKKKKKEKRKGLLSPKSILKLYRKVDYSVKAFLPKNRDKTWKILLFFSTKKPDMI